MSTKCFGLKDNIDTCSVLDHPDPNCGTTKCPFFKPKGYEDYVRTKIKGKIVFRKGIDIYTGDYE